MINLKKKMKRASKVSQPKKQVIPPKPIAPQKPKKKRPPKPWLSMGQMNESKMYWNPRTKVKWKRKGRTLQFLENGQWKNQTINAEYLMTFKVIEY